MNGASADWSMIAHAWSVDRLEGFDRKIAFRPGEQQMATSKWHGVRERECSPNSTLQLAHCLQTLDKNACLKAKCVGDY